jgi:polyisoprenoid-binding protein YceI
MQRSAKIALAAVVVVVIGGAAAFWYFVLRDTAEPEASLEAIEQQAPVATGGTTTGDPDGAWTIQTGEDVFAGYRIQELFARDTIKQTATGRTPAVSGTLTLQGDQITTVDITADLTQLASDQSRRDESQRNDGLQTATFPDAIFTLTQPITLPEAPAEGVTVEVDAVGDLTLHGVTRSVTIPLQATLTGGQINVAGGLPIVLSDFQITAPDNPFVAVDDNGELEVQLVFVKG